jgi:hypothetical protein
LVAAKILINYTKTIGIPVVFFMLLPAKNAAATASRLVLAILNTYLCAHGKRSK